MIIFDEHWGRGGIKFQQKRSKNQIALGMPNNTK